MTETTNAYQKLSELAAASPGLFRLGGMFGSIDENHAVFSLFAQYIQKEKLENGSIPTTVGILGFINYLENFTDEDKEKIAFIEKTLNYLKEQGEIQENDSNISSNTLYNFAGILDELGIIDSKPNDFETAYNSALKTALQMQESFSGTLPERTGKVETFMGEPPEALKTPVKLKEEELAAGETAGEAGAGGAATSEPVASEAGEQVEVSAQAVDLRVESEEKEGGTQAADAHPQTQEPKPGSRQMPSESGIGLLVEKPEEKVEEEAEKAKGAKEARKIGGVRETELSFFEKLKDRTFGGRTIAEPRIKGVKEPEIPQTKTRKIEAIRPMQIVTRTGRGEEVRRTAQAVGAPEQRRVSEEQLKSEAQLQAQRMMLQRQTAGRGVTAQRGTPIIPAKRPKRGRKIAWALGGSIAGMLGFTKAMAGGFSVGFSASFSVLQTIIDIISK